MLTCCSLLNQFWIKVVKKYWSSGKIYKQPTWEPLSSMPAFIKSYVENNGCGNIPDPIIKHVKTVDGNKHVMLEWTDNAGDKDVMWQKMTVSEFEDEFKFDTKKDKDKRLCRHSFGINIG